jgi:hypothetical protein
VIKKLPLLIWVGEVVLAQNTPLFMQTALAVEAHPAEGQAALWTNRSKSLICSKPSLIRLQSIRIETWNLENALHSWVHNLKDAWHLERQMSHLSVQTELETVSSNLPHDVQKQDQFLRLLSMNKCVAFLYFLNKGTTVIFCYSFLSALLTSLHF